MFKKTAISGLILIGFMLSWAPSHALFMDLKPEMPTPIAMAVASLVFCSIGLILIAVVVFTRYQIEAIKTYYR